MCIRDSQRGESALKAAWIKGHAQDCYARQGLCTREQAAYNAIADEKAGRAAAEHASQQERFKQWVDCHSI
eukprot:169981-Alexandrium_andersonii.AAC.1